VTFNNYHPGQSSLAAENTVSSDSVVTNWISVLNMESSEQSGTLLFFAQSGSELAREEFTLAANSVRDVSAHRFGQDTVGSVIWQPEKTGSHFAVYAYRYYYSGPGFFSDEIASAVVLEGAPASGQEQFGNYDTIEKLSVLEMVNALTQDVIVVLTLRNTMGEEIFNESFNLADHETRHVILNAYIEGDIGSISLTSGVNGSLYASLMSYGHDINDEFSNVTAWRTDSPAGSELSGSYNTYLGQSCEMFLQNTKAETVDVTISMTRVGGEAINHSTLNVPLSMPEHSTRVIDICALDNADKYGSIRVTSSTPGAVVGSVVRQGAGDSYRILLPLKR